MPSISSNTETLVVAFLYLSLGAVYLVVLPAAIYFYLNARWYVASSFERGFMYFLMSFCFPGMLLLAPFVNLRPNRRQING
jgi:NAD(P)H-quinone oxidoreductase subunit L